ncbi:MULTISPECIES: hypothetical protein [unclassified Nocardioides]|uniref:hypothetical protein n=1 Tax=Nocardioides sp. URHA0032 TaxID=1380388 RepID=UPI0012DEF9C9|nr:hypothetical protein [Nocardioides sp. URHA0032]
MAALLKLVAHDVAHLLWRGVVVIGAARSPFLYGELRAQARSAHVGPLFDQGRPRPPRG